MRPPGAPGLSIEECACRPGYCTGDSCHAVAPWGSCDSSRGDRSVYDGHKCEDPAPGTGTYALTNATGVSCHTCPKGGVCLGGHALPYPAKGWNGVEYPTNEEGDYYATCRVD